MEGFVALGGTSTMNLDWGAHDSRHLLLLLYHAPCQKRRSRKWVAGIQDQLTERCYKEDSFEVSGEANLIITLFNRLFVTPFSFGRSSGGNFELNCFQS